MPASRTVIAPFGIPEDQIRLTLNDTDVSSDLVLTGTALSRTATHPNLEANRFYRGRIIVADDLGRATTNDFIFDTFSNDGSAIVIEAEDYNHSGGSFFDNPAAGEYRKPSRLERRGWGQPLTGDADRTGKLLSPSCQPLACSAPLISRPIASNRARET